MIKKEKHSFEFIPITKRKKYALFNKDFSVAVHVIIDRILFEKAKKYASSQQISIKKVISTALEEFLSSRKIEDSLE